MQPDSGQATKVHTGAVDLTIGKLQAVLILGIPSPKW